MKTSKLMKLVKLNAATALIEAIVNSYPKPATQSGFYYDSFLKNSQEYLEGFRNTLSFDLYYIPYSLKLKMVKTLNLKKGKGKTSDKKLDELLTEYFYSCAEISVGKYVQLKKLAA